MLILLWGLEADPPLADVSDQLALLGVPTLFVDQRRVLETQIEIKAASMLEGSLLIGNQSINLADVTAMYVRAYESVRLPEIAEVGRENAAWRHAEQVDDILASWSELTPALVVNRFSASAANGSKPYQLQLIRALRWSTPETLITTDPDELRAFWHRHGNVIYKSISAVRSRVSRLTPDHSSRFADLAYCPTQFQQHIEGVDYRVHVVGEKVFACEVRCGADDYRYSADAPDIRGCFLPEEIEERCKVTAAGMNLSIAGIDLRRTSSGEWFCFEVNPSPAFSYYEQITGQPIAQALALLLIEGAQTSASESQFEVSRSA
jgi:hypothetical protein